MDVGVNGETRERIKVCRGLDKMLKSDRAGRGEHRITRNFPTRKK